MKIIPYEERFRDDMIFMILEAKDALGSIPRLNGDLLDIRDNYIIKGDMFWLAVEEDGEGRERVIGSLGYSSVPGTDEVFLHRFFVKCTRKRQGIGTQLLQTAEAHLIRAGKTAVRVHLGAPAERWFESRAFYSRYGYRETEPRYLMKELPRISGKHE